MIAIDTNLLVRLLTNDDANQTQKVTRLFKDNTIFLAKTVLLETEWVLRYTYKIDHVIIGKSMRNLLGFQNVYCEEIGTVVKALDHYEKGFDFADALHLFSSQAVTHFFTFDKKFAKKAKQHQLNQVTVI